MDYIKTRLRPWAAKELMEDGFPAPTLEEARDWLLNKHGIDCTFPENYSEYPQSHIRKWTDEGFVDTGLMGCDVTPECALHDAICTALEFLHESEPVQRWWQKFAVRFGFIIEKEDDKRHRELVELLKTPVSLEIRKEG